jgi:aspartyl-tRNA(Asn)/glutamyl-tRNA(Gln) amidotransferase subunit A
VAGATAIAAQSRSPGRSRAVNDSCDWALTEAAAALATGSVSSEELTRSCLARIHKLDRSLNAFITLTEESALTRARECDRERKAGRVPGTLHGIPIALKDNIDTAGVRTTAGSQVFRDRVPAEDAEVAKRLKVAGAVFLGKLNLDEFAFEGTGTTSYYGVVHNPWNLERITGGSSAGSAAAVAAGLCFASVGSDDGGSVRIPGAFCGVIGFKTSYGRVSTRGVIPSAYSLDTVGPIARTVRDAAAMLQTLAGYDPRDSITLDKPVPNYSTAFQIDAAKLRVGVPRDYFFESLHPDVASRVEQAIGLIRGKVREVREVKLPRFEFVERGSYNVELYHYQKQFFDRSPQLYHPWSREELNEVKQVETVPYIETLKRIRECRSDIRRVFEKVDVLMLPTMREPAPLISATINRTHSRTPSNVSAFNRFGTPALTLPCGFSDDGMPIGLQIVGPPYGELAVLAAAHAYEQATEWSQ